MKFIDVLTEAIDYLLLGELAENVLNEKELLEYTIIKQALLDIYKEYGSKLKIKGSDFLYEAALELAEGALSEAKKFAESHKKVFTEACKKKAKKVVKETAFLDTENIVKSTLLETALFFMTIYPAIVENLISENNTTDDINLRAMSEVMSELVSKYGSKYRGCCNGLYD